MSDVVVVVTEPGTPIVVGVEIIGQPVAIDATVSLADEGTEVTVPVPAAIDVDAPPPAVVAVDAVAYNGPTGPIGPPGPPGPGGGPVMSVARKVGDVLIYTVDIEDWSETQVLDGGNF